MALLAMGAILSGWAGQVPETTAPSQPTAPIIEPSKPTMPELSEPVPAQREAEKTEKSSANDQASGDAKAAAAEAAKEIEAVTPDAESISPENSAADPDHKIAPTETIRIDVYGEIAMTAPELRVQAGGKVKYFLIGDVDVGGKTAIEAADLIRKRLIDEEYYVNPQVIVTVIQYRKRYVYVQGDVVRPGPVSLEGEIKLTVKDAIGQAQGFTRAANKKKIQFIRKGTGKIQTLNWDKLNDPKNQIYVEPGDTIFVPQTLF